MADSMDRAYRDNPEVSHETSDVDVKAILRFAAALAIIAVVIHIALYGLLRYYEQREARRDVASQQPREEAPPEPRLRVAPRADLAEMRQAEDRLLHSYGWVDREKNIVRVPIEQAMEMVVKRGLPVRKQAPQSNETIRKPTTSAGGQGR
jgi:hypothetical protein